RVREALPEKPPKASAANLGTLAGKTQDPALRMLVLRFSDRRPDPEPLCYRLYFAERNPGLDHPERPWIHSQEQNSLRPRGVALKVLFVGGPGILHRIIDV